MLWSLLVGEQLVKVLTTGWVSFQVFPCSWSGLESW
jgi:hypothetical protein